MARSAVDRELAAQATTARHLVGAELAQLEQRLAVEARELAEESDGGGRRAVEQQMMDFAERERLTLAALVKDGQAVGGRPARVGAAAAGAAPAGARASATGRP